MFDQYDIDGLKHSSSDGQRVETQIHTINAQHASKYFGLKKGVSAYTLVANHVPCNARIIGTHEHDVLSEMSDAELEQTARDYWLAEKQESEVARTPYLPRRDPVVTECDPRQYGYREPCTSRYQTLKLILAVPPMLAYLL